MNFDSYLNYQESVKCAMQNHSNHSHNKIEKTELAPQEQEENEEFNDEESLD